MAWQRRFLEFASLALVGIPLGLGAQETPQPPQEELPMHTLHVYMDLIQVPVLVLDSELGRMKPIDPSKFQVSLDSGPVFRPRHVRQQGDDPITLGILLDTNGAPDLMPAIGTAISSLAPDLLHSRDHVSLYTLDCTLFRSLNDVPADPQRLKTGTDAALAGWLAARKAKHPPCTRKIQLWDSMGFIVNELSKLPGRRVLLVVTNGEDKGSSTKWNDLRLFAQQKGVAIFGYMPSSSSSGRVGGPAFSGGGRGRGATMSLNPLSDRNAPENPFSSICQLSGGMVMSGDPQFESKHLAKFAMMVRERYIVEFGRARNESPGEHSIVVSIKKEPLAYVRPAGVTIMLSDAELANDPDTIPRDATDAPELGTRKPLKTPR